MELLLLELRLPELRLELSDPTGQIGDLLAGRGEMRQELPHLRRQVLRQHKMQVRWQIRPPVRRQAIMAGSAGEDGAALMSAQRGIATWLARELAEPSS